LTFAISLEDARAQDSAVAGCKAAVLARLRAAGFPVPAAFVVPAGVDVSEVLADLPGGDPGLDRFAVRSSAAAEDRADASFAGQYETLLDVARADVEEAVRRVRVSGASHRVRAYAGDAGGNAIAVLVQLMLHPRAAGVAFTADPISGDRAVTLVTAVAGLGEPLVSGQVGGDSWRVKHGRAVSEPGGLAPAEEVLTSREVESIAELARRVEAVFGVPQDIEWAIDGPTLWLLQARPMTALPEAASWEPPVRGAFSRSFRLGEWIGAPVTPLFEDWLLGRIEDRLHDRHAEWIGMRGIRPYHLVLNGWYFYSLEFLPVTLRGIARSLPGMLARFVRTPRRVVVAFPQAARFGVPLYEREWREDLLPRYRNTVRDATLDVGEVPLDELLAVIDRLADVAGDYFASMAIVAGYAYKAEINLALWYRRHLGRLGESHLPLLVGLAPAPAELAGHLVESLDWWYPTRGERTPTVAGAGLRDDLAVVASRLDVQRLAATSRARQALRQRKQRIFERLLTEAQHAASVREEQVASFTLAWPLFRSVLRRLGDALVAAERIETPDDIYFLKRSEVEETISAVSRGHARTLREGAGLRAQVAERRAARERATRVIAPLSAGPFPWLIRTLMNARAAFGASTRPDALLHGAPASPGTATGAVRVIRDLAGAERLQPGEILVAPLTTPAWTPLFRIAAGVVTDVGNAMSHTSIVAREYGIPTVVGCGDATARLTDGSRVTVDGAAGTVARAD
jgi:phosphohistidine swiveling domain-containing protein